MKRKPLQVNLHAREPSVVELTVGDRVQLDRLTPSPHGHVAERYGRLLDPGMTTVALEPGHYLFRTLSDANLRVVTGGVAAGIAHSDKVIDPQSVPPLDGKRGDDAPGEPPSLTLEQA
ncbi:MAG TPA: hypothetical protein VHT91_09865 [Kofleriaceae bacterium]|nr:hypothetical protein [Kofleriaceae bacterium]